MDAMMGFVALTVATILALFAATALQALLLRAVFSLMQPATADRRLARPAIERGSQLVVKAFAGTR